MSIRRAFGVVLLALAVGLPRTASAQSSCVQPAEACAFFTTFLTALNKRDWPAYRATLDDSISIFLEDPAPVHRARQAPDEHVDDGADRGQQENRRDRELDRAGDVEDVRIDRHAQARALPAMRLFTKA